MVDYSKNSICKLRIMSFVVSRILNNISYFLSAPYIYVYLFDLTGTIRSFRPIKATINGHNSDMGV